MLHSLSTISAAGLSSTYSRSSALTTAKAILTSIGYEDLQPGIYAAEQAYQAQREPVLQALKSYVDEPDNAAYQQRLSVLLKESMESLQSEITYLRAQRTHYEEEAALTSSLSPSSSYLSQAQDWVMGQMKYFFGSTAAQQAKKYGELVAKREALLKESQALFSAIGSIANDISTPTTTNIAMTEGEVDSDPNIIEVDTTQLKRAQMAGEYRSPTSRRLLQTGGIAERCYPTGYCDLLDLMDGSAGFMLMGAEAGEQLGYRFKKAGDINGDGIDDLLLGAHAASPAGRTGAGKTYVVFGSSNTSAWGNGMLEFSTLANGARGFVLQGEIAGDTSGRSVSGAGDINGDGVADLIIGAPEASPDGRTSAGKSYVIFGSRNASAWGNGTLELSALINGLLGFVLQGEMLGDISGNSVSGAGDINGDGIADLVVGASWVDVLGQAKAGKSYVVFGSRNTSAWGTGILNISSFTNGVRGFAVQGEVAGDSSGWSVSQAGDINGDGVGDLVVGAPAADVSGLDAGKSYVVFGSRNTNAWGMGVLNVSSLMNGVQGFVLHGESADDLSGFSLSGAHDINGDGVDDLVVGAHQANVLAQVDAGKSYVVFGSRDPSTWGSGIVELSSLDGARGLILQGELAGDFSGLSVSGAGDVNQDGIDDILIGAIRDDSLSGFRRSNTYILFGTDQAQAWSIGRFNISSLTDGRRGLFIQGASSNISSWWGDINGVAVSDAGDINGDGISDLIRCVRYDSPLSRTNAGSCYVVFGTNLIPVMFTNTMLVHQGESRIITTAELDATDDQPFTSASNLIYIISNISHGQFEAMAAPDIALTQFNHVNITAGQIRFVHDNSTFAPTYRVSVSDGSKTSMTLLVNMTFYRHPSLSITSTMTEGATVILSPSELQITEDYPDDQVLFQTSSVVHGQFILSPPGTTNISQFTYAQLLAGQVSFQHDGGELAPSYSLSLQDPYFSLPPVVSNITFIHVNDAPMLVQNHLSILQGQTITFNVSDLLTTDPDNSDDELTYYVSNIQRGVFFASTPLNPLYSFTQSNISRGEIQFIHDGSVFPPYYQVTVSDGALSTPLQTVVVTFNGVNRAPLLLTAVLSVAEGQSVVLTPSQFSASDTDTPTEQVMFLVSNVTHGRFERYTFPGTALSQFSMQDIQQNTIRFVHDGSEDAPSLMVAVTDGVSTTTPRAVVVSYTPVNNPPVLGSNSLTLSEGETVLLTSSFLSATDRDNPASSLMFYISQLQQGRFELLTNPGRAVTSFSQQQVTSGQVRFVHDGSEVAPSYQVVVGDGLLSSPAQTVAVDYTPVNDAPRIILNQLAIAEGSSAVLSSSQLVIDDPDSAPSRLILTPSAVQAGQFEQVFSAGMGINSFSYQSVQTGFIRFVHNGSELPPAYTLTVSDGQLSSAPVSAFVTYTPVNDAPVLTVNRLTLNEGETVTLSSEDLAASDSDDAPAGLIFTVGQLQQGRFVDLTTGTSILSFTQQALQDSQISFSHDGSQLAPVYFISVSDGRLSSSAQAVVLNFTTINDAPMIEVNTLSITQGQSALLSSSDLRASDEETAADDLVFNVSTVRYGQFEYVGDAGRAITTFSQDKIRKADIRFVSDGSSRTPSYVVEVSDGELESAPSPAVVNFNLGPSQSAPSELSTQGLASLLSTVGSVGLTVMGYLWWRNKTAEHRRGHDFANYLRKLLNLEYYDFTKGHGDVYKTKVHKLIDRINSRHDDFYDHLNPTERQAFALCVAGLMVQKELLERSEASAGLFNWLLCFSMGWSNQLKLKEMDKTLTSLSDEGVSAWKAERAPLDRWNYKPRGTREKISAFFAVKNCSASAPQGEVLAEVRRASEHKSWGMEVLEGGEGVQLDTLSSSGRPGARAVSPSSPATVSVMAMGRGAGFFDRSEVTALQREVAAQKQEMEQQLAEQRKQLTDVHQKLDAVLVHLAQSR